MLGRERFIGEALTTGSANFEKKNIVADWVCSAGMKNDFNAGNFSSF